ncbi:MAG: phospholipase D-like domain-containing protein [Myxococcota bacterium]
MRLIPRNREQAFTAPLSVSGNLVTLLKDGREAFPAMLEAVSSAEREICLEMYWFGSDATGRRFASALMSQAEAGVAVKIIYDAIGSWESDDTMFDDLRAAGCQVIEYNPISPFRKRFNLGVVNRRDHRKILVVDNRVGVTGGVNLGDAWAPVEEGGDGWRDDMIRIEGPAVTQLRDVFLRTWAELRDHRSGTTFIPAPTPERGASRVRVLANFYSGERRSVRRAYLEQMRRAREFIYIANSYFIPDREIRRALYDAVDRGVVVRVLVPGEGDVRAVWFAGRARYEGLLRRGVELYEWQRTILHAKSAVIDGCWCTVGTYNLDHRSWRFNLEVNVAVEDEALGAVMKERFEADIAESAKLELRTFRFRPLTDRLLEQFFYVFRKLL